MQMMGITDTQFIIDDTLCIPTVFISYTGEALDYKGRRRDVLINSTKHVKTDHHGYTVVETADGRKGSQS